MKRLLGFVVIAVWAVVVATPLMAQSNPLLGTWKLNVAKSTYTPGPAPKSLTRTLSSQGENVKYVMEGVGGDGSAIAYSFTVAYDGKDYPVTGMMPGGADTIAIKKVDANNYSATLKKAGKVVGTATAVLSKDGKVTTVSSKGTGADGKPVTAVAVYEKQ
jgi:hypothetical protein